MADANETTVKAAGPRLSPRQIEVARVFTEVALAGGTVQDVAAKVGGEAATISTMTSQMRTAGIPIPKMKKRATKGGATKLTKGCLSDADGAALFAQIMAGDKIVDTPTKEAVETLAAASEDNDS